MLDHSGITLTIIIALLVANAFFVAAEFALVKVRATRLEQQAAEGDKTASRTLHVLHHLEPYLAACQLGITMASLGLGWVGEPFVAALLEPLFHSIGMPEKWLHPISFALGFLIFSSLHIVIGEQVPKTFAIREPDVTSRLVIVPLHIFYIIAWPLTMVLNKASSSLLKLLGVQDAGHDEVHSGDELRSLIEASQKHGHLKARQAGMLDKLFDFNRRSVQEVMTSRGQIASLDVTRSAEANRAIMLEHSHSRYPLVNSHTDEILGMIVVKDIYEAILKGVEKPWENLEEYRRPAMLVPEFTATDKLLDMMRNQRSHIAIVIDEYGAFSGLVSMEDLLEEIVGEIDDEFDTDDKLVKQVDNVWEVDGVTPLHEIQAKIDINLSLLDNVNTLSGLFMQEKGRLPKVRDSLIFDGFRLEVLSIEGQRVGKVRIRPVTAPSDT